MPEVKSVLQVSDQDTSATNPQPVYDLAVHPGEDSVLDSQHVTNYCSPRYISAATTTTVVSGAGVLHAIVVQGGTAGTIIGYDNTAASGTTIFSFDSTNALASYRFDAAFSTGLCVVTSAATKLTVMTES